MSSPAKKVRALTHTGRGHTQIREPEALRSLVMGTRGLGAVAGLVLGSVVVKILQLAEMPVALVK